MYQKVLSKECATQQKHSMADTYVTNRRLLADQSHSQVF